jgi:hypothetical protein
MATLIQKSGHSDLYDLRIKKQWLDTMGTAEMEYEKIYKTDSIETEDTRFSYQSGFGRWSESGEGSGLPLDTIYQGL